VPFLTVVLTSSSAKQSEGRSVMALAGQRREEKSYCISLLL
jgi:hypothetical protein